MFTSLAIVAMLACSALVARADPTPNSPGPGDVYNEGAQCPIGWTADTTGVWKVMNIELMTGSNLDMVHLTTVATVDATATTTFSWTCPQVTPNSAIYFYQFTSPGSNVTMWTTRFAIADTTGQTTPPSQATQPGGQAIPWGTGALSNPADAKPPPTGSATTGSATSAAASTPLATTSIVSSSLVASASVVTSSSVVKSASYISAASTSSSSSGSTSGSTTGAGAAASPSTTNAALATLAVNDLIFQTILALGVAAAGFTTLL